MQKQVLKISIFILSMALAGCSAPLFATPTATPTPTPTPQPTRLPTPTAVRSIFPADLVLGEKVVVTAGGYTFNRIENFQLEIDGPQALLADTFFENAIFLIAAPVPEGDPLEELLNELRVDIADLVPAQAESILIADTEGSAVDYSGVLLETAITGRAAVVAITADTVLFISALSLDPPNGEGWNRVGTALFDTVVASIEFIGEDAILLACPLAADPEYGFTEEKAIRVGGDAFDGPGRERNYFNHLRGPNGEKVAFTRLGSFDFEDTILDIYEVTYVGLPEPLTLYVDQYSFETLYAPEGFSCEGVFPLTAP